MEYIRTESGIYEFEGHLAWVDNTYIDDMIISYRLLQVKQAPFAIKEIDVIKQSDTVIELCDYVFLFDNEVTIRKITHEDDEDTIEYLKECLELGMKIKLAILTDNGLIYVSEMNDEGVLKLI